MADGVAITAGSGTTIATDDAGAAGHVQIVKLAVSTDASATAIGADANGLFAQGPAAHDATVAGNPVIVGGVSSAAAPTSVSADGEATRLWTLRNGAVATVLTSAGALVGGDATNGLDVDVTRVPTDPFGANADAASASGSISAKLRQIATNGIPDGTTGASTINSTSSDGGTALTNSAQAIKASAGTLLGWYIYNPNASAQFVQFYNTASGSVTVGTTNPLFMVTIPAASAANLWMQPRGIAFGTAMSWAATSTAGGNGAPTTALDAVCWYA